MYITILAILHPTVLPTILSLFVLVLMHEFGHIFAARHCKVSCDEILLTPLGGLAFMDELWAVNPKVELFVVFCGPLVNAILLGPLYLLAPYGDYFDTLSTINIVILVFNLMPTFPMDGGRIARALISLATKKPLLATKVAVRLSQVLCVGYMVGGIYMHQFILAMIGFQMLIASQAELSTTEKNR